MALALALRENSIGAGSRVCLLARNSPDYYVAYLGILRAGGTLFPINADLSYDEVAYIVKKTDPALVIYDGECGRLLADTWQQRDLPAARLQLAVLLESGLRSQPTASILSWPESGPDSVAVVVHTTGKN